MIAAAEHSILYAHRRKVTRTRTHDRNTSPWHRFRDDLDALFGSTNLEQPFDRHVKHLFPRMRSDGISEICSVIALFESVTTRRLHVLAPAWQVRDATNRFDDDVPIARNGPENMLPTHLERCKDCLERTYLYHDWRGRIRRTGCMRRRKGCVWIGRRSGHGRGCFGYADAECKGCAFGTATKTGAQPDPAPTDHGTTNTAPFMFKPTP